MSDNINCKEKNNLTSEEKLQEWYNNECLYSEGGSEHSKETMKVLEKVAAIFGIQLKKPTINWELIAHDYFEEISNEYITTEYADDGNGKHEVGEYIIYCSRSDSMKAFFVITDIQDEEFNDDTGVIEYKLQIKNLQPPLKFKTN